MPCSDPELCGSDPELWLCFRPSDYPGSVLICRAWHVIGAADRRHRGPFVPLTFTQLCFQLERSEVTHRESFLPEANPDPKVSSRAEPEVTLRRVVQDFCFQRSDWTMEDTTAVLML